MNNERCFIYTFYSYKGGSGRSVTAVNTVLHLLDELDVSAEHPLLVVDADLESAGLTYFFRCQNKFTNRFPDSIHTTKLLTYVSDVLDGQTGRILFGSADDRLKSFGGTLLNDLKELFGDIVAPTLIDSVFADIQLPRTEMNMFQHIVECHVAQEKLGLETMLALQPGNAQTVLDYQLRNLMDELVSLQQSAGSTGDKAARKQALLRDFLPASRFVDVSSFFGRAPGSVQFLGADVRYQDEQLLRNDAGDAIFKLQDMCAEAGYRAIVFDSGAGVQSTAHVLHTVSDVLVYCMRPTRQFIDGTHMQLYNYNALLRAIQAQKDSQDKKSVILLPTAVPPADQDDWLCQDSFRQIGYITEQFSDFLDSAFCTPQSALCEVALFKWHETILGARADRGVFSAPEALERYTAPETMPGDAKKAFGVYKRLAAKIHTNS